MKSLRCLVFGLVIVGVGLAASSESAAQFPFKKKRPFMPQNPAAKPGSPAARPGLPGGAAPGNKGTDAKPSDPAAGDVDIFSPTLLPTDFLAKLKLTAEQKPEVAKIQTEFADKLKEAIAKAKEDAAKNGGAGGAPGKGGKGKGAGGRPGGPGTPGLTEAITLRSDYEEKVYNLLDEGQQKTWLDIKSKKGEGLLTGGAGGAAKTPNKK